jgi:hypothetical protein
VMVVMMGVVVVDAVAVAFVDRMGRGSQSGLFWLT